jgi:hypothetical protein
MKRMRRFLLGGLMVAALGCYTYVPITTDVPPAGERVALHITDRGRVELADRLGPGVVRMEGMIARSDSTELVVNLHRIGQIGSGTSRWSGEAVRVDRSYVGGVELRRLSRGRTALVAGAVTAGVVAFIASRGIFGAFDRTEEPTPPPEPGSTIIPAFRPTP